MLIFPTNVSEVLLLNLPLNLLKLIRAHSLVRLRKEVEQLRMEREILKKAAVFFVKEVE